MSKQITYQQTQDLDKLMKMNLRSSDHERFEDVRQSASEYILMGKDLDTALRYARAEVARMYRPTGFISLDERSEDDFSPLEKIEAADPELIVDFKRTAVLDGATESTIRVVGESARWLGQQAKCCVRTAKSKRKQIIQEYAGQTAQMPLFSVEIQEVLKS